MKFNVQKPTENFTGREEFLKLLHKTIQDKTANKLGEGESTPAINIQCRPLLNVVAITGIPGVGKTETVLKYIERYDQDYDSVLWINFNFQSERNFIAKAAFVSLAKELNISPELQKKDLALIIKEVYKTLFKNRSEILIVFDIVEETRCVAVRGSFNGNGNGLITTNVNQHQLRSIQTFLPDPNMSSRTTPPTILITSRSQKLMWALSMQIRHISLTEIELHPWTEKECVPFLLKNLQLSKSLAIIADNKSTLLKLAAIMGQLPMGLQSASSIILENFKSKDSKGNVQINRDEFKYRMVKELIADFEAEVSAHNNLRVSGNFYLLPEKNEINPDLLNVLFKLALEKMLEAPKGDLAVKILNFIAYLSPLGIPTDFLTHLVKDFYCECKKSHSCLCVEVALNLLVGFSLIKRCGAYFSIHPSFQNFVIDNCISKTRASLQTEIVRNSDVTGAHVGSGAAADGACFEIGVRTADTDGAGASAGVEETAGACFEISASPRVVVDVDGGNFQTGASAGSGIVSTKPKICNLNETSVSRHLLLQLEKYVVHILNLSATEFTSKIISPKEIHENQLIANFLHVTNSLNDKALVKRCIVLTACVKLLILAHQPEDYLTCVSTKIELYSKLLLLTKKEFGPDHDIPLGFEAQLVKALQTQRKSELRKSKSLKHHSLKRQTSFGLCSVLQGQAELKNTLYIIQCNIQDYERKQVEKQVDNDLRQYYKSMATKLIPNLKVFFKDVTIFKNGNLAISLLSCMAFLLSKPSVIPQEFLVALFKDEGADASFDSAKDVTCVKGALSLLTDYHLIEIANEGKGFKISQVLQYAVKEIIKIQEGHHRKILFNLSQKIANYLNLKDVEVEDVEISANIDYVTQQLTF